MSKSERGEGQAPLHSGLSSKLLMLGYSTDIMLQGSEIVE
jgi:hypothetical protein